VPRRQPGRLDPRQLGSGHRAPAAARAPATARPHRTPSAPTASPSRRPGCCPAPWRSLSPRRGSRRTLWPTRPSAGRRPDARPSTASTPEPAAVDEPRPPGSLVIPRARRTPPPSPLRLPARHQVLHWRRGRGVCRRRSRGTTTEARAIAWRPGAHHGEASGARGWRSSPKRLAGCQRGMWDTSRNSASTRFRRAESRSSACT